MSSLKRHAWPACSAAALGLLFWLAAADRALTRDEQKQLIDRIGKELREKYVFPDVGARMADELAHTLAAGVYDAVTERAAFANKVTGDMQDASHDKHLRLLNSNGGPGPGGPPPGGPRSPVDNPERLAGNIGYIPIHGFPPPDVFRAPFDRAMKEMAGTDAIVIDVRNNGGGSPQSVMLAAGYFIPKRTLVAKIYSRPDDTTTEMWTTEVPGPHYEKPLYILTNHRTFSAAEAMAYHMKALGRAIIVGETSGGGAHRVMGVDLGNGFVLLAAVTRPTNVVTGGDWEGTGVAVDIPAPAKLAVQAAQASALKKLPVTAERTALIEKLELELKK